MLQLYAQCAQRQTLFLEKSIINYGYPFLLNHTHMNDHLHEPIREGFLMRPPSLEKSLVLGKATTRAAIELGLSNAALARLIGLSEPDIGRIASGARGIDPESKEGQLGLLLVRLFRSLDRLVGSGGVGSDGQQRAAWLRSHNKALNAVPIALIEAPQGLVATLAYLDAIYHL